MYSPSCYLDVIPYLKKNGVEVSRRKRQETATRIIRKHLVQKGNHHIDHVYRRPGPDSYQKCCFLDNHSTVLALDDSGVVDIVKLVGFGKLDAPDDDGNRQSKLVSSLSTRHSNTASPLQQKLGLKSFNRGSSFVVGLPSGELQIYDTEYASAVATAAASSQRIRNCAAHRTTRNTPWLGNGKKNILDNLSISQTMFDRSEEATFVTRGWRARRPLRRYQGVSGQSLGRELRDPTCVFSGQTELPEWDNVGGIQYTNYKPCSLWSFWELSGNSLLALHVNSDYLGLTVADTRQNLSQTAICLDTESTSKQPNRKTTEFSTASFFSEFGVASWAREERNQLSIWDLRRTKEPVSDVVLPSFPRDLAIGMKRLNHFHFPSAHDRRLQPNSVQLTPFRDGRLLVSILRRPSDRKCWHLDQLVVDPALQPANCVMDRMTRNCTGRHWHPFALSQTSNLLALYDEQGGNKQIAFHSFDLQGSKVPRGRKRTNTGVGNWTDNNLSEMNVSLPDRWGTSTELNSLEFSLDGSCLAGTSRDGDLFSWRA